jgi:hypothetical protein
MSMGRRTKHKVIFALIVITTVLLIVWAGYVNYRNVAVENNATIMADLITYLEDNPFTFRSLKILSLFGISSGHSSLHS